MSMRSQQKISTGLLLATLVLGGCSGGQTELLAYIDKVKARPGGRIETLPQIKPYENFTYDAVNLRSPFLANTPVGRTGKAGPRPEPSRPREYLEQFSIDTLAMAGTISQGTSTFGLVKTKDGLLHKVQPGNYIGEYNGRVVAVTQADIQIEELVPDGIGGFFKRSVAIALGN